MKVLVTGGAGYVGSVLTQMLLDHGHGVVVFDNFMYGAQSVLAFSRYQQLLLIKGDVRDRDAVANAIAGCDYVLHLAAIVGYPACAADTSRATTTNVDGTRNVVECMNKGQRLVFASTVSTYGKVDGVATEETPIAPLTLYGRNKRDAEEIISASGVEHVTLRFATVFGSSPRMRLDLLINDFAYQALRNRQIILYEGHFRRTFIHILDAAASYLFAMDNFDRMARQVFNVGSDAMNCTKKDIALRIQDHVDYYLHEADVDADMDKRDYVVDYGRMRAAGFAAMVTLDEGIRELLRVLAVLEIKSPMRNA